MPRFFTAPKLARVLAICTLLGLLGLGLWLVVLYIQTEYHLRQARQFLMRQRYPQALEELHLALRFRPHSADLQLLAGRTARQSGNFPIAWDHLHRCRELQKGVSADLQLEEYLLRAQTGEVEEVHRFLFPYLSQEGPQTPLVLEALSHVYLFRYRFDLAGQCLQRWVKLEPDNVQALFLRGNYYVLRSQNESAIADLRHALELDPERIAARLLLADSLRTNHRSTEAIAEYETVIQQEPNHFAARLGLAACYVDMKELEKAEALLEPLSREQPEHAEVLYLRGRVAEGQERYEEAIRFLRAAAAANPAENSAYYHLVQCCQHLHDEAGASEYQEMFDRIERDQKRLQAITNDQMNELPTNPALCCELGEVCLRLGITRRGVHWLHVALRLDPRYRRAHEQLLHYYERLGPEGEEQATYHRQQLAALH